MDQRRDGSSALLDGPSKQPIADKTVRETADASNDSKKRRVIAKPTDPADDDKSCAHPVPRCHEEATRQRAAVRDRDDDGTRRRPIEQPNRSRGPESGSAILRAWANAELPGDFRACFPQRDLFFSVRLTNSRPNSIIRYQCGGSQSSAVAELDQSAWKCHCRRCLRRIVSWTWAG